MKKVTSFVSLIALVLAVLACDIAEENKGSIELEMSLEDQSEVQAEETAIVDSYFVKGTGENGETFSIRTAAGIVVIPDLASGTWHIVVTAVDVDGNIVGDGQGSAAVTPGVKTSLVIIIIFVRPTAVPTSPPTAEPTAQPTAAPVPTPQIVKDTGTVRLIYSTDSGYEEIIGESGVTYRPINLPDDFKIDGLRVAFTGYIRYIFAEDGILMIKTPLLEIISIRKIEPVPCYRLSVADVCLRDILPTYTGTDICIHIVPEPDLDCYPYGTPVRIKAPDLRNLIPSTPIGPVIYFSHWEDQNGAIISTSNPLELVMRKDMKIAAKYKLAW
ncbi:MAG: PT domain-containing protein [Spirochaetales bacterium]|nr:PT domain-containing protein [Spirochaetales bacterium]